MWFVWVRSCGQKERPKENLDVLFGSNSILLDRRASAGTYTHVILKALETRIRLEYPNSERAFRFLGGEKYCQDKDLMKRKLFLGKAQCSAVGG